MSELKAYLAHAISTKGEFEDSKRVANRMRGTGVATYAAAENSSINDKSNNPTPIDIYDGDVSQILESDVFVVCLSGGHQDGTISEVGVASGFNSFIDILAERLDEDLFYEVMKQLGMDKKPIIAYTSNARLLQPQHYHGIASASANHLVLGMIDKWGKFVGGEDDMIKELERLVEENNNKNK